MKQKRDISLLLVFIAILVLSIPCPNLAAAILVMWIVKRLFVDHSISTPKGGGS